MKKLYELVPVGPIDTMDDNARIIFFIVGGAVAIYFLRNYIPLLEHWRELPAPNSYVAAFYHYTLGYPTAAGNAIWDWASTLHLTPYFLINLIITLTCMALYLGVLLAIAIPALSALREFGISGKLLIKFLIAPLALLIIWDLLTMF